MITKTMNNLKLPCMYKVLLQKILKVVFPLDGHDLQNLPEKFSTKHLLPNIKTIIRILKRNISNIERYLDLFTLQGHFFWKAIILNCRWY